MSPYAFLSNMITFNPIGCCLEVSRQAKIRKISAPKILSHQLQMRRKWGVETHAPTIYDTFGKIAIEKFTTDGFTRYYAIVAVTDTEIVALGTSAKDAYKSLMTYLRSDKHDTATRSRMRIDSHFYSRDKKGSMKELIHLLNASDIIAPKKGRIVN